MSLTLNIAANYVSQFYVVIIGIIFVPVYLRLMGAEAFGLVAFFTLLQTWFQLLDVGLAATMSRETARYLGGSCDAFTLRRLLRSLEGIFWSVGLLAAVMLACAAPVIASEWLNRDSLSVATVESSIAIMACAAAMRWTSGLYRGAVSGLERQVWLSGFNIVVVTIRFVGVIPVLLFVDTGPVPFFTFQAVVSCLELIILVTFSYSLVRLPQAAVVRWSLEPLRGVFKFSAVIAFSSIVGVLITQTDKLILSKVLSLRDYGLFTAAVLVASGITLLSVPVSQALLPRLTRISQQSDDASVLRLYRQATEAIAAIAGSTAIVLAIFAKHVLWVWTGDVEFAESYAPVLALYSIGNGFLALAAFPYYLQFAKGDMTLHFWGNVFFVLILIPAIVVATTEFGVIGAGSVWALTNALFFLMWTPVVHNRFAPGLHRIWLIQDVFRVLAIPLALGVILALTQNVSMGRIAWGVSIIGAACGTIVVALLGCTLLKPQLRMMVIRLMPIGR